MDIPRKGKIIHHSLKHLIAPDIKPKHLAGNFGFTEGPAADADGNIFFVDIGNHHQKYSATLSFPCFDGPLVIR